MTKCKFLCNTITEWETAYEYSLSPVYGSEENRVYWEATPSGSLKLSVVKSKGKLFEVGKTYSIDISESV